MGNAIKFFSVAGTLLRRTASDWIDDNVPQFGAALAYYTVFSFAPLLLLLFTIVGELFQTDPAGAWSRITQEMNLFFDERAAKIVESIVYTAAGPGRRVPVTVIGICLGLFGASSVFAQLQGALNTIWKVKAKPSRGLGSFLRARFLSFAMVGGVCFLLLVSLTIEAILSAVSHYLQAVFAGGAALIFGIYFIIDFVTVTVLFSAIFKFVPDARIRWRHVWVGGSLTAILFLIGKWALGLYLTTSAAASAYGAASSLITLLLWVYYSAQILLFGAEFTRVYSNYRGLRPAPSDFAVRIQRHEIET